MQKYGLTHIHIDKEDIIVAKYFGISLITDHNDNKIWDQWAVEEILELNTDFLDYQRGDPLKMENPYI